MLCNTISVGSFEVNCSILSVDGKAWIVDPGADAQRIAALVEKNSLAPGGILLTHAHFDHIGAVGALQKLWPDLKVYMHPADVPAIDHPFNQFPPDYPPVPKPANILPAAENPVAQTIETPGHTPGGVCYYLPDEKLLFSGDTLFAGSVGRTDFPGGSMPALRASLAKLKALPDDTRVVPGHGGATTIGAEKRRNPFMQAN